MSMMGGSGMGGWHLMRSFRRDDSVRSQRLSPGLVRRIARFAAPYRRLLLVFLVLIVIDAAIGAANPLVYAAIIDHGILPGDSGLVVGLALLLVALAVLRCGALARRAVDLGAGGRGADLRHADPGLRALPADAGRVLHPDPDRCTREPPQQRRPRCPERVHEHPVVGRGQRHHGGVTLLAMFFLSWQITLLALVLFPMFVLPARWVGRRIQAITRESYNLNAAMTSTMTERFNVAGALLVRLFGQPLREIQSFEAKAGRVRDIGVTQAMFTVVFMTSLLLTASIATALVYGVGGWLAVEGALQVGTVVALAAYLNRLYGPLTSLSNVQVSIMTALVSFDRIFEVLDLKPLVAEKPDAVDIPRGPASVEFEHVDFSYPTASEVSLASLESVAVLDQAPSSQVLYDVSFTARPGELVALVGPSGAGKTTISQLVPRLYDVRAGAVRINGLDTRDASFDSLREMIGVVTQDAHLFHDTIRANLLYARPDASEAALLDALRAAQILPFVRTLPDGLDTVVGDRGYRLSGGEKQRIAIARLLLKAPDIVVLDEATAHLDSESEVAVQEALRTALAGRTSIVIAHRLSTIRQADQILVIAEGRIVERGSHAELLAAGGLYDELYRTQFAVQRTHEAVPGDVSPQTAA